jgi:hypothetical protein
VQVLRQLFEASTIRGPGRLINVMAIAFIR